ncbi:hypothetical protein ACP26L_05375 [Paenibacillus sp. S-38]|uniref:hypothetical protein n=1 Tax=Paenibacillus sp. S-38 TaxID=3416710 RepID=UPI003CED1328
MALGIVPLTAVHTRKNAFDLYQTGDGYPSYPERSSGPEYGDMKPVEPLDEIEKKKQEAKELQEQQEQQRRKEGDPEQAEKKRMLQQLDMLKAFYTNYTPDGSAITAEQTKEGLKQQLSKAIEQTVQNDKVVWDSKLHQFRMEISREAYEKQAFSQKEETGATAGADKQESAAAGSIMTSGDTDSVTVSGSAGQASGSGADKTDGSGRGKFKEHGSAAVMGSSTNAEAVSV